MYNDRQYKWVNIAGAATTDVFTGAGTLGSIIVNSSGTGGTITISDRGSPAVTLGTITLSGSPLVALRYDASISGGLRIVTSASPNITVTYTY